MLLLRDMMSVSFVCVVRMCSDVEHVLLHLQYAAGVYNSSDHNTAL